MADKMSFQQKLADIMQMARENGMCMTAEEAERFFYFFWLTREQMEQAMAELDSQLAVQGYVRKPGTVREAGDREEDPGAEEAVTGGMSGEEKEYLEEYLRQLRELQAAAGEGAELAAWLRLVAEEAVKLHQPEVFIGGLIQEGSAALVEVLGRHAAGAGERELVMADVRAAMKALLASQAEMERRDRRMVDQVARLDEAIRQMTDELGRKVDVQEVAARLELTEEQVRDILKLTGEEPEDEAEA